MSAASEVPERPLRADALRNRERIITAARELIALRGLGVGLNDIAHHAGLGVGTVYRRFPDRDELIQAALAEPLEQFAAVAGHALREERAFAGLRLFLLTAGELLAANLGLRTVALSPSANTFVVSARERFAGMAGALRARAIAEGDLRPDITDADLAMVLWMVSELAAHSMQVAPDAYRRYLELLLDGMRAHPEARSLPAPVTAQGADDISRNWAGW